MHDRIFLSGVVISFDRIINTHEMLIHVPTVTPKILHRYVDVMK